MRKDRKEKFKKIAVVAGLSAIGVLAVAGICLSLKKEEPQYIAEHLAEPEKTVEPEITAEPVETGIKYSIPEPSATPEIAVSTEVEPERAGDGPEQSIQPDPVRTEEQKPEEPPKEAEDMAGGEKENPPENREIPAQPTPEPAESAGNPASTGNGGAPQNGTVQDGKIYIDGFGWIGYNGGESDVVEGGEIYENGNTIGIMD